MKFSVISNDLSKALSKIISVVPSKSTLPILENVLCELVGNELRLTASDLEISMRVSLPVNGQKDGIMAIPAKKLNEALHALPSTDLTVSADGPSNRVTLKTDQGEYRMAGEAATNFPETEAVDTEFSLDLESPLLRNIVGKTVFAVSSDDLRPSMMGVLFQWKGGEFRAVSTDGHRLVQVKHAGALAAAFADGDREIIIPAKALNLMLRTMESGTVTVAFGRTNVRFIFGDMQLVSRIIDERYPNYESVIPQENTKRLDVSRAAMISAVKRCSIFSNAVTNQIRFSVARDGVRVFAEDVDSGGEAKESVSGTFSEDEDLDIGFNAKYIADALAHLESDDVSFYFSTATRAGLLRPAQQPEDLDILMLVMPLRLNA